MFNYSVRRLLTAVPTILILIVCMLTMYIVSMATREPDYEKISGLTYGTVTADQASESRGSWDAKDVFWSGAVIAGILAAYLYFRG